MTNERDTSPVDRDKGVTPSRKDISVHGASAFRTGLLTIAVVVPLAIWLLFTYVERRATRAPEAMGADEILPGSPLLQTMSRDDLQEIRDREAELLSGYSWVDRDAGVVRIPIDEAMRLILERGLPVHEPSAKIDLP